MKCIKRKGIIHRRRPETWLKKKISFYIFSLSIMLIIFLLNNSHLHLLLPGIKIGKIKPEKNVGKMSKKYIYSRKKAGKKILIFKTY
jgi:hypothetical protein